MHTCFKCGGRIIFRRRIWHVKAKRYVYARHGALVIHLDGPCGQLLLGLN